MHKQSFIIFTNCINTKHSHLITT